MTITALRARAATDLREARSLAAPGVCTVAEVWAGIALDLCGRNAAAAFVATCPDRHVNTTMACRNHHWRLTNPFSNRPGTLCLTCLEGGQRVQAAWAVTS